MRINKVKVKVPNATKLFPNQRLCVKNPPLPQFKVAFYKCLGIRLSFEDPTTLLPGGGGKGRIGRLRSLEKMPPKNAIFSTVLSKIVALARERKPYRIRLLFTHKNSDFGAISVTEQSCTALISEMEHRILDKFGAIFKYSVNRYWDRTGSE